MSSSLLFRTMLPSDRVLVTSPARIPINPTIFKSPSQYKVPRPCPSSGLHSAGSTSDDPKSYLKLPSFSLKEQQIKADSSLQAHVQVDHFEGFNSWLGKISRFIEASWKFVKPYSYSLVYFACGSLCIATRVWIENAHLTKWSTLVKAIMLGFITLWSALGFVNGLNQIYDLESDKINKPYLPLASGDISLETAWVLVKSFAVGGILTTVLDKMRPEVTFMYCLFLILGVFYSVPPFRMKRVTASATLAIVAARFLLSFGLYYTSRVSLGLPFEWSPAVAFIVIMSMINALVCSIIKDVPDMEGDRKHGVHTLASKVGGRNITFLGTGLQLLAYVAAICSAIFMPQAFKPSIMIPAHATMALILIYQAWMLEKANYAKVNSKLVQRK